MDTPWGPLHSLDPLDLDLSARILATDKHQLLEGLVVECIFDQIISCLGKDDDEDVFLLDVDTIVVDTKRSEDRWVSLVWARAISKGLGRLLLALENCSIPYLLDYADGTFYASEVRNKRRSASPVPLNELMIAMTGRRKSPFEVHHSVRDHTRQRQAFWGFISNYYRSDLWEKVVLPRILINCGIQPYFKNVWNIDRILVSGQDLWALEIKHKFPINKAKLFFGINNGGLLLFRMLADSGLKCLHTVLVKPYWNKSTGPLYLLNDLNLRARTAVIAYVLDEESTASALSSVSRTSGKHTSITGRANLSYRSVPAESFSRLGVVAEDPRKIADLILSTIENKPVRGVSDDWLRHLRAK